MRGNPGGPGATSGQLIIESGGRGRGVIGTPAGRGENFKLTGSVSEGPESERSEKGAAVFCFGDGGDAFFGFIAAQFKFSIAETQGPGGLKNDTQIPRAAGTHAVMAH